MILCFSLTEACKPRYYHRVMTEEGKHPILCPVNDYSSCCSAADQRISNVQVINVTNLTTGSQGLYTYGPSIDATVKDNQIELNVSILNVVVIFSLTSQTQPTQRAGVGWVWLVRLGEYYSVMVPSFQQLIKGTNSTLPCTCPPVVSTGISGNKSLPNPTLYPYFWKQLKGLRYCTSQGPHPASHCCASISSPETYFL